MSGTLQMMLAGVGNYIISAADFDGTNDYLWTDAASPQATDGTQLIFSAWLRIDGGDGTTRLIWDDGVSQGFEVYLGTANKIQCKIRSTVGALLADVESNTALLASASWVHILICWYTNFLSRYIKIYVNDVLDSTTMYMADGTADFSRSQIRIGESLLGGSKFNGCMAELYFAPTQYLDFTVESNRRKFINTLGKPVYLGNDGSIPTGTAPYVFLRVPKGDVASSFSTNRGTGTAFSTAGSLDLALTSPSD